MNEKADIGLVGLAVMGENLVLNIESRGFTVSVYNRTLEKMVKLPEIAFTHLLCKNGLPKEQKST